MGMTDRDKLAAILEAIIAGMSDDAAADLLARLLAETGDLPAARVHHRGDPLQCE